MMYSYILSFNLTFKKIIGMQQNVSDSKERYYHGIVIEGTYINLGWLSITSEVVWSQFDPSHLRSLFGVTVKKILKL